MRNKCLICFLLLFSFYSGSIKAIEQTSLSSGVFNQNGKSSTVDQTLLDNKVKTLNLHRRWGGTPSTPFAYSIQVITPSEYQIQKPSDAFPFDAGYLGSNGVINVSEPSTAEQLAVFKDVNQVALFYLCKAYISYYYNYNPMPAWFSNGFAAYESHLDISDATIKTSLNSYGGSISSFDILNDRTNYIAKNGLAVSYLFGEFMSVYHCWHYFDILNTTATTIEPAQYWFPETMDKFISQWNRYLSRRILESDENMRIKVNKETEHFRFYYRNNEAFNFPAFSDTLEKAYVEYTTRLNVQALEKLTMFTIPECETAAINDIACGNRLTSGTAWSSGLNTSCAYQVDQVDIFARQNRHELAHTMQGLIPQGNTTAWMNEGFPGFYEGRGPFAQSTINKSREGLLDAMQKAEIYFGHRPTYEDTRVYPSPDYGYYNIGAYFVDFIYRRGNSDATVKDVFINDVEGYKKLGYNTPDDFLNAFYFDFDVRIGQKGLVTLIAPTSIEPINDNAILLQWTPLNSTVKLNVSISTDNKVSWTPIASSTTQTTATWDVPSGFLGQFYIKFSHPDYNLETVFGPFTKGDASVLSLLYPNGGEKLFAGDSISIKWANTNISSIRIDFSSDNGITWSEVKTNVPTNKRYIRWLVPSTISNNCKVRITDMANSSMLSENQNTFRIIEDNTIGGPYKLDENTVLLMHFDGDLTNQSTLSGNGNGNSDDINYSVSQSDNLGQCVKTNTPITIAHCANLNLSGDWTIEAWVKTEAFITTNYQTIVSKPGDNDAYQSNYSLLINPYWDNVFHYLYFSKKDNRIGVTATKPAINEWYHVMCTRDTKSSEIKIIVRDKNLNIVASQSLLYTGNETYTNFKDLKICDNFNGYIDELRISNVVRKFDKPAVPTSPIPQDNTSGINTVSPISLNWTNGEGANTIDLYLGKTNPPTTKVLDNISLTSSYSFSNPDPATKYYWKVVCRNLYGIGEGPVWSFTTASVNGIDYSAQELKLFSIYPNPVKTFFNVSVYGSLSENATIKIFDTVGRIVFSEPINQTVTKTIGVEKLSKGVYFVQIQNGSRIETEKLVIE